VRIIAGRAKGRRLQTPSWDGLRPTSDRLRETLFNILAPRIDGARVLDGYAGTGAIGIEALSRGAAHAAFVETDPRALKLIAANLESAGMKSGPNACTIIRAGFLEMAKAHRGEPFDIVVLDPPYAERHLDEAVETGLALLREGGLLVLEHASRVPAPPGAVRTVKAGDSSLSFYEKR